MGALKEGEFGPVYYADDVVIHLVVTVRAVFTNEPFQVPDMLDVYEGKMSYSSAPSTSQSVNTTLVCQHKVDARKCFQYNSPSFLGTLASVFNRPGSEVSCYHLGTLLLHAATSRVGLAFVYIQQYKYWEEISPTLTCTNPCTLSIALFYQAHISHLFTQSETYVVLRVFIFANGLREDRLTVP